MTNFGYDPASVGAHWEETGMVDSRGQALFAARPRVYAAAFSGFYVAMITVLCAPLLSAAALLSG